MVGIFEVMMSVCSVCCRMLGMSFRSLVVISYMCVIDVVFFVFIR